MHAFSDYFNPPQKGTCKKHIRHEVPISDTLALCFSLCESPDGLKKASQFRPTGVRPTDNIDGSLFPKTCENWFVLVFCVKFGSSPFTSNSNLPA